MKEKYYKRCPRCNSKVISSEERCYSCGLIFERLKKASNAAAKKAIKKKEYNKVVYSYDLPRDISKVKLLLTAIFLGLFGIQYAKVGRYKMFIFMIISFFLIFIYTLLSVMPAVPNWIFTDKYIGLLLILMTIPSAFAVMMWATSIFQIIFNRFRVPVAIDEEYVVESINNPIAKEILSEVKKSREENDLSSKNRLKRRVFCAKCGEYVKLKKGENTCPKCGCILKGNDKNE